MMMGLFEFVFQNASVEELEERPTANWIRRQLHFFAQARREVRTKSFRSVNLDSLLEN